MSIRKHPTKGKNWWYIEWYPNGKKGGIKRIPFKGTELEARDWEMKLRRKTKNVGPGPTLFPQINSIIPQFMHEYKLDHVPSGVARTLQSFKFIMQFFGRYQLTSINHELVAAYKSHRSQQVKPSTIQKELCALSVLCKWGEERGYCQNIKIKKFPKKIIKPLSPVIPDHETIEQVLACIGEDKRGIFQAMYYAGLRHSEARLLQTKNVDLKTSLLMVTGKGNKQRVVPIVNKLTPILKERIDHVQRGYLWTNEKTGKPFTPLKKTLYWAAKKAGVEGHFYPHLLRHCFGVEAIVAGIGMRHLQVSMGHSDITTTEIYTNLAAEQLKSEFEKLN